MGNSTGNIAEYWAAFEAHPHLQVQLSSALGRARGRAGAQGRERGDWAGSLFISFSNQCPTPPPLPLCSACPQGGFIWDWVGSLFT